MKKIIFTFLICGMSLSIFSQTTSKNEKIKQLIKLKGSGKLALQILNTVISQYRKIHSEVDQKFWDEFEKEIKVDDLINLVIPIYDKYYTEEDIDQLISFYKSPVGQKTIEITPQFTQESMTVGQNWGKQLGEKVMLKLKDKGYLKN